MTPAEIIDTASRRCGKRGVNDQQLNINMELLMVIQQFCKERPWQWRTQTVHQALTVNTNLYDLQPGFADLHEVKVVKLVLDPATVISLDPVDDPVEQASIIEGVEPGQPTKYFMKDAYNLVIYPVPDADNAVFPLRIIYKATPSAILDGAGVLLATVPLIPGYLHDCLVKGLEKQILRYAVGEEDAKYTLTANEYAAAVSAAWEQ